MNTLYLLILLFLVWFSLANNMASFGIIVSILIIVLALVGGIGKRSVDVKADKSEKAPAVKQQDVIYVPVVEDTEAPYLYPPHMKIQIRPDVWGMSQFEEPAHALGQGMQGIIRMFKKLTR